MRFSPFVPPRRPTFGRRKDGPAGPGLSGPSRDERRLIDRIIRHMAGRGPR